jgi:hypothetical protein
MPFHGIVFEGMARGLASKAESIHAQAALHSV